MDLRSHKKAFLAEVLGEEEAAKIWEMAERATKQLEARHVAYKEKPASLTEFYADILHQEAEFAALPYVEQVLPVLEALAKERKELEDEEPWSGHPANPFLEQLANLSERQALLDDALRRRN